jgi:hypothetical protein
MNTIKQLTLLETITFLNECKAEDTELLEHCLKEREQQIKNETL